MFEKYENSKREESDANDYLFLLFKAASDDYLVSLNVLFISV